MGPITAELFVPDGPDREDRWEKAESDLLDRLSEKALSLGANCVVALEVTMDPFAEQNGAMGLRLFSAGTAAKLEPLA